MLPDVAGGLKGERWSWIVRVGPVATQGSLKVENGDKMKESEWRDMRKAGLAFADFEDGGRGHEPRNEGGEKARKRI